jgi:hypothetical protein
LVAFEFRGDAERALESATSLAGEALKVLLAGDVTIEKAAALLERDITEVRRLVKAESVGVAGSDARPQSGAKATVSAVPDASEGDDGTRRTG